MVSKLIPEVSKVYFINKYTMIHILEGSGGIQVDFKNFHDWTDKLIFLEKGQYIKFLSEDFIVRKIEFDDVEIFRNKDFRVLFKHLVSLGYINFNECENCQHYLSGSIFSEPNQILDVSSRQWFWQNPFGANNDEYHIIFDVKDMIDEQFRNHLNNSQIVELIGNYDLNPQAVYTQKVGITIKNLLGNKRLLESKKSIAFDNKSIKEIAYDFGYKDPAYFNRVFKSHTGSTPNEFRKQLEYAPTDDFLLDLYELIKSYHHEHRKIDFYADKMHYSVKTLSKKVRDKLQITLGQVIRQEILKTAKLRLLQHVPVQEVARELHFEESNHFTAFFKHYEGISPSDYLKKHS
ncbi:MAG: AraC family transcriptional regulator [Flavobacteriales bacterium]|nr:AraC family transcriptional regulator [Flavobacteriales bacterium]